MSAVPLHGSGTKRAVRSHPRSYSLAPNKRSSQRQPGLEARRHPVEKCAQFYRHRLPRRVDDMDRQRLGLEVLQHDGKRSRPLGGVHLVRHPPRQPGARNGRQHRGFRRVDAQARSDRCDLGAAAAHKSPRSRRSAVVDSDAIMIGQVVEPFRMPTRLQVRWAAANHDPDRPDPGGDDPSASGAARSPDRPP